MRVEEGEGESWGPGTEGDPLLSRASKFPRQLDRRGEGSRAPVTGLWSAWQRLEAVLGVNSFLSEESPETRERLRSGLGTDRTSFPSFMTVKGCNLPPSDTHGPSLLLLSTNPCCVGSPWQFKKP